MIFRHSSAGYPGEHRRQLDCIDCHTNNREQLAWPFAAYRPDCAGCHAADYRTGPHKKYQDVKYTVAELRDCTGSCHVYEDSSLTVIKDNRTNEHRVSDGDF